MESLFSKETFSYKKKIVFNAGVESYAAYLKEEQNHAPKIQLLFSPFGLPFVPLEIVGTDTNKIITSLQWTKDRNNPGGVCVVVFAPDAAMIKQIVSIIDKYSKNLYSKIWGGLGVEVEDLFKPMTLCQLWIDGYHIFTGYARGISRSADVSNSDKNVSYTLSLDELGSLYNLNTISMDYIVKDQLETNMADSIYKVLDSVSEIKYVPLSVGIQALLGAFKTTTLTENIRLSDGFPLAMRLLALPNPLGAIAKASLSQAMTTDTSLFQMHSTGGGQQSFWSFLKNFIPSPWMEFFTESGGRTVVVDQFGPPSVLMPGFNYVVSRTTPYSNPIIGLSNPAKLFETLPYDLTALSMIAGGDFVIITDKMIQSKELGVDSSDQSTVFHTYYTSRAAVGTADMNSRGIKSPGAINPFASGGIKTFGVREMFQTIECTNLVSQGIAGSAAERIAKKMSGSPGRMISQNAFSNLLAVWFRNQARFREGSITVKGMPWARAGMYCLYLPTHGNGYFENIRDIGLYYIDSVSHSYSLSNNDVSFETTLNVIRGTPIPWKLSQLFLLLFDWEVLPPDAGIIDGEYTLQKLLRMA